MKKFAFIFLSVALAACSSGSSDYDATGMFEATEVIVSAEQNGRLLSFTVEEGDRLQAGSQVGLIDTVQLQLRALQLGATKDVYATQRPDIETQIAATRQELAKAEAEQRRYEALVKDNAAYELYPEGFHAQHPPGRLPDKPVQIRPLPEPVNR